MSFNISAAKPLSSLTDLKLNIKGREIMKNKILLTLSILFLMMFSLLYAQSTTINIGNSASTTNSNMYPIDYYYQSSLSQTIYYADEIGTQGMLSSLTYRFNVWSGQTTPINKPIKIWLANTTATSFASNASDAWIPLTEFTEVYNTSTLILGTGQVDVTFEFLTPFAYTGNNLVVMVQRPMDTAYFSSSYSFQNTATPSYANRLIYYYNDYTEGNPATPPTANGRTSNVPNTKFIFNTTGYNSLAGTVRKMGSEIPVTGAKVKLGGLLLNKITDAYGIYQFPSLSPGTYSLEVSKQGYNPITVNDVVVTETGVNSQHVYIQVLPVNLAVYTEPLNNKINQYNYVTFKWNTPTDGEVTGYKFNLWLLSNPDNPDSLSSLVNNEPLGLVNAYSAGNLEYNAVYYWQVIPFDVDGDATNCPIWKFTTLPNQSITSLPYLQNFDIDITTPALPLGWTSLLANASTTSAVSTLITGTPYSTPNHVSLNAGANLSGKAYLITPPLAVQNARVRFFAKAASSSSTKLTIGSMSNPLDTLTFVPIKTITLNTSYTEYFVKINNMTHDKLVFRNDGGIAGLTLYLDNIQIETIPSVELKYSLSIIDFGRNYQDRPKNRSLFITNQGSENALCSLELPLGVTTMPEGNISILPDQILELIVTQNHPETIPSWSDSLIINTNDPLIPRKKLVLQGQILPPLSTGIVEVADGAVINQSLPIEPYFGYSLSQSIFYPSELYPSDNHAITQIAYEYNGYGTWTDSLKIWFDMVPKTEFSSSSDWVQVMSNNLVYQGTISTSTTPGWITLTLTKPFIYDANLDLVVTVKEYSPGFHTSSDEFYTTPVTLNRSLEYHNDSINPDPYLPGVTGTLRKYIPNTRFKFEATAPEITFNPDHLTFTRQFVGSYSAPQMITLFSSGTGNVWVDSFDFIYPDTLTNQYSLINTIATPFVLQPGEQQNLNVVFNPTVIGTIDAQLQVVYRYHLADEPDTLLFALTGNSVDATINEYPYVMDFSGELFPPYGWTSFKEESMNANSIVNSRDVQRRMKTESNNRDNQNLDNWLRSMTYNAGEAPELQFHWSPSFTGRSMFISPVINATDKDYVKVGFNFNCIPYYNNDRFNMEYGEIGLMVKSGAGDWMKYWTNNVNDNNQNNYFERIIDISTLANPKFQIAFYFEGNSWTINDWYIDNISIEESNGIFNSPMNLVATPGYKEVQLSWDPAMPYLPNTLVAYNIYRDNLLIHAISPDSLNNFVTMFTDNEAVNEVEYNYYVTALYNYPNGESMPSNSVNVMPFMPPIANGINLNLNIESVNSVRLDWNLSQPINDNYEFRYDDGNLWGCYYNHQYNNDYRLGNVYRYNAEINEVSWFSTSLVGGNHSYASVHIYGLDMYGYPTINQLLYENTYLPNQANSWNYYSLPYPVSAPNGFIVCVDFPDDMFEIGVDDGVDEPWGFTSNVCYVTPNVYSTEFYYQERSNNVMIRARGINRGFISIPRMTYTNNNLIKKAKSDIKVKKNNAYKKYNNTNPQRMPFDFEGYKLYRNNELIANLPADQTLYYDTLAVNGVYEYFVKGFYSDNVTIPESNHQIALIGPFVHLDRDTLNYDKYEVNRQTPFWDVVINNPGSVTTEIDSVYLSDNVNFSLEPLTLPYQIMPFEGMLYVRVAFNPQTVGTFEANLTIVDSSNVSYHVSLYGMGVNTTITEFPYFQNFSGLYFPPLGWRSYDIDPQGDTLLTKHFNLNDYSSAGGDAPELMFQSYNDQGNLNGKALFISPVINADGIDNMIVRFKHFVQGAYGLSEIGLAVKSTTDTEWIAVWAERPQYSYMQSDLTIDIDVSRMSNPNYQFAFYFKGDSNRLYQWSIDDVELAVKPPLPPCELMAYSANNAVNLHWMSPEHYYRAFLGYNIYRDDLKINQAPILENQYTDLNVINNNNYLYYVTAVYSNPTLESEPSNIVRVTPMAPVLNPPQNINLGVIDEDDVVVHWNRPSSSMMEDFEIIMPGWKTYDLDNNEQYWTLTDGHPHSGMYSVASFAINDYYYGYTDNWLVSPKIHISGPTQLKFWMASVDTLFAVNTYQVLVSTESDSVHHFVHYLSQGVVNSPEYQEMTLDLSEFSGQNIHIAWVHEAYNYNTNAMGILMDDVSIVNQNMRSVILSSSFENVSKSSKITPIPAYQSFNNQTKLAVENKTLASKKNNSTSHKIASQRTPEEMYPYTKLIGYKIFRNNTLLTTVSDSINSIIDYDRPDGTQSYQIFAVYNKGLSTGTQSKKAFVGRSIMPNPSSKDFGTIPVLGQTPEQVFALVNNGTKKIKPNHIALNDTVNFGMIIHQDLPDSMMIGDTIFVSVYFKPQSALEFISTFVLVDSVNNFQRPISITGIGNPLVVDNFPFNESFTDETFPPSGWSAKQILMPLASPARSQRTEKPLSDRISINTGRTTANWSRATSNLAGGDAGELRFYYSPSFTGVSMFISPIIDATNKKELFLHFKHYVDWYANGFEIGVAVRKMGDLEWTPFWSIQPEANIGPENVNLNFPIQEMELNKFQFCFYFYGDSYDIDNWYIDNIKITEPSQTIPLCAGWNIISANLLPNNLNAMDVFQSLIQSSSLVKVQNEAGASLEYVNGTIGWVNDIGNFSNTEGYKVKVSADDSLRIIGQPLDMPFEIPLTQGWNIMGYPAHYPSETYWVFYQLLEHNKLIKVQNESGAAFEFVEGIGWIDNIGLMMPGEGYKLKVSADTLLCFEPYYMYTASLQSSKKSLDNKPVRNESKSPAHFIPVWSGNGLDHMNIYVTNATVNSVPLIQDQEIAVYDGNICVGAVKLDSPLTSYVSIPVSRNENTSGEANGYSVGNAISFRIWNGIDEYIVSNPAYTSGSQTFQIGSSAVVSLNANLLADNENSPVLKTALNNAYPNPFNPTTRIDYALKNKANVSIEVYNVKGQKVKTLVNENKEPGKYNVVWSGDDNYGKRVSSGIYFYRMEAGSFKAVKKAVLLK